VTGRFDDAMARSLLRQMFDAAVASADPRRVLADHLPLPPRGRCVVVGAGKAAASMAAAVEAAWPAVPLSGLVVAPYGYAVACGRIEVIGAGHPVPDANSAAAARAMLNAVRGLTRDDMVLSLVSGGGSAALALPASGLTLEDKQVVTRRLLASGLDIRTMNAVRKRLSAIKGGRLAAAAAPARVVTLAISDVPGDDPGSIASGPTVADATAALDLRDAAARLGPDLPARVIELLAAPLPPPAVQARAEVRIVARPAQALAAAAETARAAGVRPILLGDAVEGDSAAVARAMAAVAATATSPAVFLSGGETTVTLDPGALGRGGPNTEFVLALTLALRGRQGVWALAADTDGQDGTAPDAAGALMAPDSLARAKTAGLDPIASLAAHDSGGFFAALGDLVVTGPTRTNVNDFRAILAFPAGTEPARRAPGKSAIRA
jgi:hydroxypyruvate reductase